MYFIKATPKAMPDVTKPAFRGLAILMFVGASLLLILPTPDAGAMPPLPGRKPLEQGTLLIQTSVPTPAAQKEQTLVDALLAFEGTAPEDSRIEKRPSRLLTALPPVPGRKPDMAVKAVTAVQIAAKKEPVAGDVAQIEPASGKAPPAPKRRLLGNMQRDSGASLGDQDSQLYKKIFAHQTKGEWDKADKLRAKLLDDRLRGYVLAQRYLHPASARTSFEDLVAWLDRYPDHAFADKIYKLAAARRPAGSTAALRKPAQTSTKTSLLYPLSDQGKIYASAKKRGAAEKDEVRRLALAVRKDVAAAHADRGHRRLLNSPAAKSLDKVEYDQILALIARGYMQEGKIEKAVSVAAAAAQRSGRMVPQAGWIGGLSAWRLNDYARAAVLFETAADSPYSSAWQASAGAYWASRSHMRSGNARAVSFWLRKAAAYPRTFYGLIATRALGWDYDFDWGMPEFTNAHKDILSKIPAARRAMTLAAAGQFHIAEAELKQIPVADNPELRTALIAYAHHAGLPAYAMRLAEAYAHPDGGFYDAALYPLSPWVPEDGFSVDKALIHAIIRQESRFNPSAQSRSGAKGLMQLMPATANDVAGTRHYKNKAGQHGLTDPETNLDIGQKYIERLLYQDHVETELFSLVIAYNAGPGNLRRWKEKLASVQDDPLLFVESLPVAETRAYVERVMANYWIYRMRLDQATPSLDATTQGKWALYVPLDRVKQAGLSIPAALRLADNTGRK